MNWAQPWSSPESEVSSINMTLLQAILLGIVQGITEFLPISSSGHLVLFESLFQLNVDQLKDFDIVVHVGTLLAILVYFWRDIINPKYWPWLIVGTIPAVIIGFTLEDQIDSLFRSALSVGIIMLVLGLIFMIPEKWGQTTGKKITWWRALLIGIAQAIAIIPGVSRSGSTILTGRMLGINREEAARFSFLLGSIAIAGAGLLTALDLSQSDLSVTTLIAGFLAAFISGLISVVLLMRFLKQHSLKVFGIYLSSLGVLVVLISLLS